MQVLRHSSKSPERFEDSFWLDLAPIRERFRELAKAIVDVQEAESQQEPTSLQSTKVSLASIIC